MNENVSPQTVATKGSLEPDGDAILELPIRGFRGTPEEIERQWFEKIYTGRGDSQKQQIGRASCRERV